MVLHVFYRLFDGCLSFLLNAEVTKCTSQHRRLLKSAGTAQTKSRHFALWITGSGYPPLDRNPFSSPAAFYRVRKGS